VKRRPGLETLTDALAWLRDAWEDRDVPRRLHERSFEGEGLFYAPAFARFLSATSTDQDHQHGKLRDDTSDDCLYKWPMWRAIELLHKDSERSWERVLTLVINAYDVTDACTVLHCREGHILDAIRALHSRYRTSPGRRIAWTAKSESQQKAEMLMVAVA
jgi:hypothetical protein